MNINYCSAVYRNDGKSGPSLWMFYNTTKFWGQVENPPFRGQKIKCCAMLLRFMDDCFWDWWVFRILGGCASSRSFYSCMDNPPNLKHEIQYEHVPFGWISVFKVQLLSNTNRHGKCIHVDVGMLWQMFTMQMESVKITKNGTDKHKNIMQPIRRHRTTCELPLHSCLLQSGHGSTDFEGWLQLLKLQWYSFQCKSNFFFYTRTLEYIHRKVYQKFPNPLLWLTMARSTAFCH